MVFLRYILIVFLVCFSFSQINSQDFNGKELLEKAISYHDPYSNWGLFNADFVVNMESPNRPKRKSKITPTTGRRRLGTRSLQIPLLANSGSNMNNLNYPT